MDDWKLRPARDLGMPERARLSSTRREPGLLAGIGQGIWALGVKCYLRAWHRLDVEGRARAPRELPFVMVANHTSHLDALVLASLVPWRARRWLYPIAAGDVFFEGARRSFLATLLLNALPMQRGRAGRHAIQDLRSRLVEDPCGFVLFPEGTRSPNGRMLPFKAGLGMLVAGTSVPVVPCHIDGAFAAWPRTARFPRPRRLRVRVGEALDFANTPDDRSGWEQVAHRSEAAVRALEP